MPTCRSGGLSGSRRGSTGGAEYRGRGGPARPTVSPRAAVEGDEEAALHVVGQDDDERTVRDGQGAEAVDRKEVAEPLLANPLAVETEGAEPETALNSEGDEDALAVAGAVVDGEPDGGVGTGVVHAVSSRRPANRVRARFTGSSSRAPPALAGIRRILAVLLRNG